MSADVTLDPSSNKRVPLISQATPAHVSILKRIYSNAKELVRTAEPETHGQMDSEQSVIKLAAGTLNLKIVHDVVHSENLTHNEASIEVWDQTDYHINFTPNDGSKKEIEMGHIKLAHGIVVPIKTSTFKGTTIAPPDTIQMLAERGVGADAKAVGIDSFFPFSLMTREKENLYRCKGIGSALLSKVLDDCASESVAVVIVYTQEVAMVALLRKFGFEQANEYSYFKVLSQAQAPGRRAGESRAVATQGKA